MVVLDEATAHLDSESEVAVQRALDQALQAAPPWSSHTGFPQCAMPTRSWCWPPAASSQQGSHEELLGEGGMYRMLYETQFATSNISTFSS